MQKDAEGWPSAGGEFALGLLEQIRPIAAEHGVSQEELADALSEAIFEATQKATEGKGCPEDHRCYVLGLTFWKLFGEGTELWITLRTERGSSVPFELLVTAYKMWRRAVSFAVRCGVGTSEAAEALAHTTHATADQIARIDQSGGANSIRSIHDYLFAAYIYLILRIAAKSGSIVPMQLSGRNDRSDEGAFQRALEDSILLRELLGVMAPQERRTAIIRSYLGFSWPEVARVLKTSINAVQKAQSVGLRKALETCTRDLKNYVCAREDAGTQRNKDRGSHPGSE
jgi:DNA-directed RNA polymerase specialized sigma24 family protein